VWLRFAALSPDLTTLAAAHGEGRLALFDLASWSLIEERTLHQHHIYDVRYARDGRLVTAGLDGHVRVWRGPAFAKDLDIAAGGDEVLAGALSPDGNQLAAGGQDGSLDVWDVARTGWIAHRRDAASGTVWRLIFTPDGRQAISAHDDGTIRLWPTTTWEHPFVLDAGEGAALSLAIEGDVLVAGYRSGAIGIWDLATRTLRHRIGGRLRERGSCPEIATQTWSDAEHAAIVANACKAAPVTYADALARRSHQHFDHDVDVVWDWQ
jgi:WD40 repeat protein